jgi:gelsolin
MEWCVWKKAQSLPLLSVSYPPSPLPSPPPYCAGKSANMFEKRKGVEVTKRIDDSRKGVPVVHVLEEGDSDERFWGLIEGGFGPVAPAPPPEFDALKDVLPKLFSLSDASGSIAFNLVGEAATFPRNSLQSQDVFILDSVTKVYAWVGGGSSKEEQHQALLQAAQYLVDYDRPSHLPICKVKEGAEGAEFLAYFTQ